MPSAPILEAAALDAAVRRILGNPETFFRAHWRKTPFHNPGAADDFAGLYDVEDFLRDLACTHSSPHLSVSARDGKRFFTKHTTIEDLRDGVLAGGVSAMKASKFWHGDVPESWKWMRALFGALLRSVAMMYMSPGRSEDVDIFLAGPQSHLGCHFDTTDVFTVQLHGERRWVVDETVALDRVLAVARGRDWIPAKEIGFQGPTREYTLKAGDLLYVPAYAVHHVTGVSWSVSLSLGLRAFNEIDILESLLESVRLSSYMNFEPVPAAPESLPDDHIEAKLELMRRVCALLGQLEGVALATLMTPLTLPDVFLETPAATAADPVLGMFQSGFALEEDSDS